MQAADDSTDMPDTKGVWEATAEEREASLKERKAKMILAARQYVSAPLRFPIY